MAEDIRIPRDIKDLDMAIAANGDWFYQGSKISRSKLVRLFSTVLRLEDDGRYFLQTPAERGEVSVAIAPFIATLLTVEGEGEAQTLTFQTNVEDTVKADADHPLVFSILPETGEPLALVEVRNGLTARMNRPVFYQLMDLATEDPISGELVVWSSGKAFPLTALSDDLAT